MQTRLSAILWVLACAAIGVFGQPATTSLPAIVACRFAPGTWNTNEWILVKSPRWEHCGGWEQKEDHIQNRVPPGATPQELLGKLAPETYTSMVYDRMLSNNVTIRATMMFTDRMAPLIVLAPGLAKNKHGIPEYREHYEIIIYDEGVNVWHHFYADGKPSWKRAAWGKFALKPEIRYQLEVKKTGKKMEVSVAGHTLGFLDESLPEMFYVGVTGCEGINRFYDFQILHGN